jgi:hypothetical protein
MPATCAIVAPGLVTRPRFVSARAIEKPPQHGEKPFDQLVSEAFDGPVLRLSNRLRLLEEASNRHIRRGDALDLIHVTQKKLEQQFAIAQPTATYLFAKRYAKFAIVYVVVALAWCVLMASQ